MDTKKIYDEIQRHIMEDDIPSLFLNELMDKNMLMQYPFTMLSDLKNTDQNLKYHPEGSVWNHTLMVVDEAAVRRDKSSNPRVFMWSTLLHDIGKAPTTKIRGGRITSYNHERIGRDMAEEFLNYFGEDSAFVHEVSALVRWHMEPLFVLKGLQFSNIKKMLEETSLEEVALLALCDRFGRGNMSQKKMNDEEKGIRTFVEKCRKVMESK